MAQLVAGSEAAKSLGIHLGQLYGWVKSGKVKNHKEGGYPDGKGLIVDLEEAREAWTKSKKKGPREPGARKSSSGRRVKGESGEITATRVQGFKQGTIVSYSKGMNAHSSTVQGPRYTVAQVLASNGRITVLDKGERRRHYDGTQIDNVVFYTDRLATMMARGVARIERPTEVLGMLLLNFILEGKLDTAKSLERWMEKNGIEVIVPEITDIEEDFSSEVAKAVGDD